MADVGNDRRKLAKREEETLRKMLKEYAVKAGKLQIKEEDTEKFIKHVDEMLYSSYAEGMEDGYDDGYQSGEESTV